jgi:hypothetical protein
MLAVSDGHGGRFHQDFYQIEIVQGKWSANILVDYCWGFIRNQLAKLKLKEDEMSFH